MEISNIKTDSANAIIFGLCPIMSMGALIYLQVPNLFLSIDVFKLLILLTGLTVPIFLYTFYGISSAYASEKLTKGWKAFNLTSFSVSGIIVSFELGFLCFISYFFEPKTGVLIALQLGMMMIQGLAANVMHKEDKKKLAHITTQESKTSPIQN